MNLTQLIDIKEKIAIGVALTDKQRSFVLECINEACGTRQTDALVADFNTPNYIGRINNIWAFLSTDDDGEGVCAAPIGNGMLTMPLIAADKARLESLKPIAQKLANLFNKPVRLAKFTTREDVEVYQP